MSSSLITRDVMGREIVAKLYWKSAKRVQESSPCPCEFRHTYGVRQCPKDRYAASLSAATKYLAQSLPATTCTGSEELLANLLRDVQANSEATNSNKS